MGELDGVCLLYCTGEQTGPTSTLAKNPGIDPSQMVGFNRVPPNSVVPNMLSGVMLFLEEILYNGWSHRG